MQEFLLDFDQKILESEKGKVRLLNKLELLACA